MMQRNTFHWSQPVKEIEVRETYQETKYLWLLFLTLTSMCDLDIHITYFFTI